MPTSPSSSLDHLRNQRIDETRPGTILRDFQTLLEFIGPDGVRSAGKNHLLPMERLFELDERLTHPQRPQMKRPQQKSFPNINGLYLLLRATRIGVPQGMGKTTGLLVLDSATLADWQSLNPTERYFNLLEAWLRHATWEMVGQQRGGWLSDIPLRVREMWQAIPAQGQNFDDEAYRGYCFDGVEGTCTLALCELFGLVTVLRGQPAAGKAWRVAEVHRTAFGDELLAIAIEQVKRELFNSSASPPPPFGAFQPALQESFPDWQNNLTWPQPEFRDGVYYFKVSLGHCWRRIAMPADADLDQLAERDSMVFQYDYGADWRFNVQLEKVAPPDNTITQPQIVESHGEAPPEYDYDDDE